MKLTRRVMKGILKAENTYDNVVKLPMELHQVFKQSRCCNLFFRERRLARKLRIFSR